ncbi:MAG: TonB-dependent receptor plug domain-containing protein [Leadbetterella sp.]|nr:TonB-dependent receptor plug domain-containing protein [Leadbetterella sp.]
MQGKPVPGVSILEKGTANAAFSDAGGAFKINVSSAQSVLIFSFVGMTPQEITVGDKTSLNVEMQPSSSALDEVVVVGYGVQKKSDVISSVLSVNTESVNKVPANDLGEMLRGKAAGVYVTLGDAAPGSSSNILIRGSRSLTAGNAPIVIADGVPIGGINDINPNDIASIEILKDAAAQAITGRVPLTG